MKYILCLCVAIVMASCLNQQSSQKDGAKKEEYRFNPVVAPTHLTQEGRSEYMNKKYWDKYDFADTVFLQKVDSSHMFESFVGYVMTMSGSGDSTSIQRVIKSASVQRYTLDYFHGMVKRLFNDPNSQFRSDDLYAAALRSVLESPLIQEWERFAMTEDLKMLMNNRVGHKANEIVYTTKSGAKGRLHKLKADYTLIFIHNPGCAMCGQITSELNSSEVVNSMLASGRLKILAIYTDEDLVAWRDEYDKIPSKWINSYDDGVVMMTEATYNLIAIPALYLLDGDKIVLVKDSVSVPEIEYYLSQK